jgi:hypothetical protein
VMETWRHGDHEGDTVRFSFFVTVLTVVLSCELWCAFFSVCTTLT